MSDDDAIRFIRQSPNTFVCYLGAGASSEAGVKTASAICDEIRDDLTAKLSENEREAKLRELEWDDVGSRYANCITARGSQAVRVEYFRRMLQGVRPAFCHHAVAMLASAGVIKKTILTTNFDKLVESAFTQQGALECQPIRNPEEIDYWGRDDEKAYVVKLHGDYDTHNIANTVEQIVALDKKIQDRVMATLESSGLIVLGAAGHEKSIYKCFDELEGRAGSHHRTLDFGLLWSVYMGPNRPRQVVWEAVKRRIDEVIGPEIRALMKRAKNEQFAFFPVWGSGEFLLRLIDETGNSSLMSHARRRLDHEMRLRDVFSRAGLTDTAITDHLKKLAKERERFDRLPAAPMLPRTIIEGRGKIADVGPVFLRLVYGDITLRRMLDDDDVRDVRRAIVSPEDTCISAGGGVAYQLLKKAGPQLMLNELSKLQPIPQGTTAVTSGGDLPVEYVFHGAALKIESDGAYSVDGTSVQRTVQSALMQAEALGVGAIWFPLFGAGVAKFSALESLNSILEAIRLHRASHKLLISVMVFSDDVLPRTEASESLKRVLAGSFDFDSTATTGWSTDEPLA